jgi:hypothetical protein
VQIFSLPYSRISSFLYAYLPMCPTSEPFQNYSLAAHDSMANFYLRRSYWLIDMPRPSESLDVHLSSPTTVRSQKRKMSGTEQKFRIQWTGKFTAHCQS